MLGWMVEKKVNEKSLSSPLNKEALTECSKTLELKCANLFDNLQYLINLSII